VDPGVGGPRRVLAIRSQHFTFLAPDNGVLDSVLHEQQVNEAVEIDVFRSKRFLMASVSHTFHGRDIFAPIAAHLSMGKRLHSFGKTTKLGDVRPPFVRGKMSPVKACILHIDHFGNMITNIFSDGRQDIHTIAVSNALISRWIQTYEDAPDRTPCMIIGSSGLVEIVVKKDHAARLLNADIQSPVTVYWS